MVQLMYNPVRYLTDLEKSPVKQAVVEGNGVTFKLHPQLKNLACTGLAVLGLQAIGRGPWVRQKCLGKISQDDKNGGGGSGREANLGRDR
jgi:hypothetical protein